MLRPAAPLYDIQRRGHTAPLHALLELDGVATAQEVCATALSAQIPLLGDRGSYIRVGEDTRVLSSTSAPDTAGLRLELEHYPEIVAALERREVLAIEDVHEHPLLEDVRELLPRDLRSVVVIPVWRGDAGVFLFQSMRLVRPSSEDLETGALVAKLAARLLESRRLLGASRSLSGGARPIPADSRERAAFAPPAGGREADVLLVEDDPDHAEAIVDVLGGEGYRVRTASSGESALSSALEEAPDLILLDMGLPDMDGFAVAEALAETPATASVPILFVSGSDDLMLRIRGAHLGETDFLMKPFAPEELLARTERSLEAAEEHQRLRDEANLDPLTGLGNLRLLERRFALEEAKHRRHRTPLSLVIIDADRLKKMNDVKGHLAGDEFLAGIGDALQNGARDTDLAVRYGGDEFVVLLPNTPPERAEQFAGRTLQRIRELRPQGVQVSVSLGLASLGGEAEGSLQELLERADEALYRAKRAGGDRMCESAR